MRRWGVERGEGWGVGGGLSWIYFILSGGMGVWWERRGGEEQFDSVFTAYIFIRLRQFNTSYYYLFLMTTNLFSISLALMN